jgi:hypothetical protein
MISVQIPIAFADGTVRKALLLCCDAILNFKAASSEN